MAGQFSQESHVQAGSAVVSGSRQWPPPIDQSLVESTLVAGFSWLMFPRALESQFLWRTTRDRWTYLRLALLLGALLFAALLISDWFMVPDVLPLAATLRLLVFPIGSLVGTALLWKWQQPLWGEWGVALGGLFAAGLSLVVMLSSSSPLAYLHVVVLLAVAIFTCTIARFWPAVMVCLAIAVATLLVLMHQPNEVQPLAASVGVLVVSCMAFSLIGNYRLEHGERMAFLLDLRERALHSDLQTAHASLAQLATTDGLTGLANRRRFDEFLGQQWTRAQALDQPLGLMLVDIDHFKAYNDRYGHPAGDQCLCTVGQTLQGALRRPADLVARWGGEEFAAVLSDTDLDAALAAAERVRAGVQARGIVHAASRCALSVTVSIGLVVMRPAQATGGIGELLRLADEALYRAKSGGRNRVCLARPEGSHSPGDLQREFQP